MEQRIQEVLENRGGSYILPFFWQHGESEEVLRDYMRAIYESNIWEVCVECRPHPDFCGPKWWEDLDVILDEANKRDMKVWILDDDHFPTGHANGGIQNADLSLRPWYVDSVYADCYGPSPANRFDLAGEIQRHVTPVKFPGMREMPTEQKQFFEKDEEILSIEAWKIDADGRMTEVIDLKDQVKDGILTWDVPNGSWRIYVVFLTHNGEGRTDYINILDHDSVRVLIDEVYEKHYARYPEEFGKTIRGFFSDEPMTGNIRGMYATAKLGDKHHRLTNPWSKEMPGLLEERLGKDWKGKLALLWNDGTDEETVKVRQAYMDAVTLLISKNFSCQLADWCESHGVEYIGHIWEDKTLSCALGGGLGHFFRAMKGNHMGGVDIVFRSSMLPWGDCVTKDGMSGDFYYHVLGKLASSHASFDQHKKGRAMCESFGATGWDFGVDKMKYVADNLLVSGINRFVPHAFSPKAFPDPDCPPHFYAHGENAQYRHFAKLMEYIQRVCHVLDGGKSGAEAAILYPAENDWVSELDSVKNNMPCDVPARLLAEAQIDYHIVPVDLLEETSGLLDGKWEINGVTYKALIVPAADYVSPSLADFAAKAEKAGFPVIFLDCVPKAETEAGLVAVSGAMCQTANLVNTLREKGMGETYLSPESRSVKCYHYVQENDIYMLVNNNLGVPYQGTITIPNTADAFLYDAYENVVRPVEQKKENGKSILTVTISAYQPLLLFFGTYEGALVPEIRLEGEEKILENFRLSSCMAKEYPKFGEPVEVKKGVDIAQEYPEMLDFLRYETEFDLGSEEKAVLKMDYSSGGMEVWCNDVFCGQKIAPDWSFDLSKAVHPGKNTLRIEVAMTPDRKTKKLAKGPEMHPMMGMPYTTQPEGILGEVRLFVK